MVVNRVVVGWLFSVLSIGFVFSAVLPDDVRAQPPRGKRSPDEQRRLFYLDRIHYSAPAASDYLQLTKEQQAEYLRRITAASEKYAEAVKNEDHDAQMASLAEQSRALDDVLTPAQRQQKAAAKKLEAIFLRASNDHQNFAVALLLDDLFGPEFGITSDQVTQLKKLAKTFPDEIESIKDEFLEQSRRTDEFAETEIKTLLQTEQEQRFELLFGEPFEFTGTKWEAIVRQTKSFGNPSDDSPGETHTITMNLSNHPVLIFLWPATELNVPLTDELVWEIVCLTGMNEELDLTTAQIRDLEAAAPKWSQIERDREMMTLSNQMTNSYQNYLSDFERQNGRSKYPEILVDAQIKRLRQIFNQILVHVRQVESPIYHPAIPSLLEFSTGPREKWMTVCKAKQEVRTKLRSDAANKIRELHRAYHKRVYELLNAEQQKQWDAELAHLLLFPQVAADKK